MGRGGFNLNPFAYRELRQQKLKGKGAKAGMDREMWSEVVRKGRGDPWGLSSQLYSPCYVVVLFWFHIKSSSPWFSQFSPSFLYMRYMTAHWVLSQSRVECLWLGGSQGKGKGKAKGKVKGKFAKRKKLKKEAQDHHSEVLGLFKWNYCIFCRPLIWVGRSYSILTTDCISCKVHFQQLFMASRTRSRQEVPHEIKTMFETAN